MSLDATDQKIVASLQQDGRTTIRDLSELVGLPESTTRDRIRNLEERGVIQGYHTKVDPEKVGLHILAWVFVDVEPAQAEGFAAFVDRQPAVVRGHGLEHKDGAFSLKVAAKSTQELTRTLQQWTHKYDLRVRDLLLIDDVRPRDVSLKRKEDQSVVLGALSEKY